MSIIPALPDPAVLADIETFLASTAGEAWIATLAANVPDTRYWRGRSDCWSLKELNRIAAQIIDARRAGHDLEFALEAECPPAEFGATWHAQIAGDLRAALDATDIGDTSGEIRHAIREAWEGAAAAQDDSCVTDLFASHDRCELLFVFTNAPSPEDGLIYSRRPWPEAQSLVITRNLQFALANLGFTVSEFRKASGNASPATEYLQRSGRRRRPPIIAWDQLNEIIDNACSTTFLFTLYAVVPITDVLALDLAKPVTFEKCWVASMDPLNGTFQDVEANSPVTVDPGDGVFMAGGHLRWPPEEICALYTPHYHAAVRN